MCGTSFSYKSEILILTDEEAHELVVDSSVGVMSLVQVIVCMSRKRRGMMARSRRGKSKGGEIGVVVMVVGVVDM